MTLEEAIKVNQQTQSFISQESDSKEYKALGLGIEALKHERQWRLSPRCTSYDLLPGETEK